MLNCCWKKDFLFQKKKNFLRFYFWVKKQSLNFFFNRVFLKKISLQLLIIRSLSQLIKAEKNSLRDKKKNGETEISRPNKYGKKSAGISVSHVIQKRLNFAVCKRYQFCEGSNKTLYKSIQFCIWWGLFYTYLWKWCKIVHFWNNFWFIDKLTLSRQNVSKVSKVTRPLSEVGVVADGYKKQFIISYWMHIDDTLKVSEFLLDFPACIEHVYWITKLDRIQW